MNEAAPRRLSVLCLASLFPDNSRPNFGGFVERSLIEASKDPALDLTIVAPIRVPIWPLSYHPRYRGFLAVPIKEQWKGVTVYRPRYAAWPGANGRLDVGALMHAMRKLLRKELRDKKFDVIDAQFFFPDGPAAVQLGAAMNLPVTIKARGSDLAYWAHNSATVGQVLNAGQTASALLAVSEAMKLDMVALGMDARKINVHYTGLDSARFHPLPRTDAKAAFDFSGPTIGTVGALVPIKGQEIVLRALQLLPGVTYVLAGIGDDQARLQALAETLGVADRVKFLGSVAHHNVPSLLSALDVMVLVSEREGLANAWLEALACGTPVVMSDVGGAREILPDSDAAHIVERTPQAVAQAVQQLLASPPLPAATSTAIHARFSWQKNARELVAYWRNLAGH